ncbi:hypothetical protein [Rhodococcoides kroppenstedtii]|uniref:hypothetical protein n=1 Tax=Rhodococcoides kroppenstedtii TaxID=293050 RepID=UPI001BDE0C44|nr:hypothetical protein [Rhodococcus kroppenstedtii]MBT1193814.1 hypothetical protein [Rhodococcus kroppenstedtii]
MTNGERWGRAERLLRARRRRLAADYNGAHVADGGWTAGPEDLGALASEAEQARYGRGEGALDLEERVTAWLGPGWDEGPEPDPWGWSLSRAMRTT